MLGTGLHSYAAKNLCYADRISHAPREVLDDLMDGEEDEKMFYGLSSKDIKEGSTRGYTQVHYLKELSSRTVSTGF